MGDITPEMVGAIISLYITDRLLDAQKEAREALVPFADRALLRAEEQFAQDMMLRGYDETVYAEVNALPEYEECSDNIYRGQRTGHFSVMPLLKQNAFNHSIFNCGSASQAVLDSLSVGIVHAMQSAVDAANIEKTFVTSYLETKYVALANSASFKGSARATNAFGQIGNSLQGQYDMFTRSADISIAQFAHFATKVAIGDNTSQFTPNTRSSQATSQFGSVDAGDTF